MGVNADGSAQTNQRWAAHFDGKDYPVVGAAGVDMVTTNVVGASTMDFTIKMGGEVTGTSRLTVSKDGKTISLEQTPH